MNVYLGVFLLKIKEGKSFIFNKRLMKVIFLFKLKFKRKGGINLKKMKVEIDGDMVRINDILIFGVHDLEIGDDFIIIKRDSENLIHIIDYEKAFHPYFTVIRIKEGERLAHNYRYCNFEPLEIIRGYHKKTL